MSQKAWMQAYTKGTKALQARLAKIHANNPEFQEFVKKHGFGGNLSVKQSGQQKTSIATVKPVDDPHPERKKGPQDREAMIKAAFEKAKDRRRAHANRVAFGGELGGGFALPNMRFRTYRESLDYSGLKRLSRKPTKAEREYMKNDPENQAQFERIRKRFAKRANLAYLAGKKVNEDVPYKDAAYTMRRGGWVVKRNGKIASMVLPTEDHAKAFINSTRKTLAAKVAAVVRRKAKEIAHGMGRMSLATESAANRRRVRSWDSAVMPELKPVTVKPKKKLPFDADPPKKNLGVVVGKNDPGYSRARHLARLGLKKAMEQGK